MTDYRLRVITTSDQVIAGPSSFIKLDYSKAINATGAMSLVFLDDRDNWANVFTEDTRIQIWRDPEDGASYLELGAVWFVTKCITSVDSNHRTVVEVVAKSALDLADRRIVAYHAGTSQATINNKADDQIKRVVSENLGSSATGRAIPGLTVEGNTGLAPVVNKQVPWRGVLQSIQEIARDSEAAGTPLYYDIVATGATTLEFKTWIGQPGAIRTDPVLSLGSGTLRAASWGFDREGTTNIVYGLGPEFGGARVVVAAVDPSYNATPFSRRESSVEARVAAEGSSPTADTQAEANAEMKRRKPKEVIVTAEAANNRGARYGVHWNYGDRITVSVGGRNYACLVEAVRVSVSKSREQIQATLRF